MLYIAKGNAKTLASLHLGELYTAVCSPTDAALVATGGGDDRGFLWRISQGDWAFELQGREMTSYSFSNGKHESLDLVRTWFIRSSRCVYDSDNLRFSESYCVLFLWNEECRIWTGGQDKSFIS